MSKENNELHLIANEYRDIQGNEFTQVIASCKCGRGGWIRLPKHPDIEALIQQKQLEAVAEAKAELRAKFGIDADKQYDVKIGNGVIVAQLSTPPKKEET